MRRCDISRPFIITKMLLTILRIYIIIERSFSTSFKNISKERRFAVLSHFVVSSLPLSYLPVLPQSSPSELLLYIMKKVELVVCFLIWYCSRNGAVLLGTQKARKDLCVPSPCRFLFFATIWNFSLENFGAKLFAKPHFPCPA